MIRTALTGSIAACAIAWSAPALAAGTFCDKLPASLTAGGPERLEGAEPHVYRRVDGADLRLHVLRPAPGTATGAAVVLYVDGGWMFDKIENQLPLAKDFAARGLTVVVPDLRTYCHDRTNIVEQVEDGNAAFRWVRAHARDLAIDPKRIAVAGGSAGGHIALSAAMFPKVGLASSAKAERPSLLLLFFPCVDPTAEVEQEVSAPAIADRGAEVSPLLHLTRGLPRMLILQGTDDSLYAEVNEFCAKANALGNSCTYAEYAGAKHGFFHPGDDHYQAAFARLEAYLVKAGYLRPVT